MKTAAAPGYCLGKLVARHQMWQESRTGRPEKSAGRAGGEETTINPKNIRLECRNQSQAEAGASNDKSRQNDNLFALEVVGNMASRQGKENHRAHLRQTHQS